jgi:hypothetical protein
MDYVEISNNGAHGLTITNSAGWIYGTTSKLAGTGNAGFGAFVDVGSNLFLASGATPTLTGAGGECTISSANATWVNINGGTVLSDVTFMELVRKY